MEKTHFCQLLVNLPICHGLNNKRIVEKVHRKKLGKTDMRADGEGKVKIKIRDAPASRIFLT